MTCEYCKGSKIPGIHFPSDFDDREDSRDGKVFIARCDECWFKEAEPRYHSDEAAARYITELTGWPMYMSYDHEDSTDPDMRAEAREAARHGTPWFRPYFKVTLAEAAALTEHGLGIIYKED